jgi:hypothetical protein
MSYNEFSNHSKIPGKIQADFNDPNTTIITPPKPILNRAVYDPLD